METKPNARVLLDSISPTGHRVTTMEVTLHRFVLAEFNTHRAFSRNSASSRAIPAKKMIERVKNDPAIPIEWPAECPGMRGCEEPPWPFGANAETRWMELLDQAIVTANDLMQLGVHKSIVNRVLEPFQWQTIICTATAEGYENFFNQRCSPLAQPEMHAAAVAMQDAWFESNPRKLEYGEWHTPLIRDEDYEDVRRVVNECAANNIRDSRYSSSHIFKRISAARCARVSYLTHDGKRDIDKDLDLYDKLVSADPPHWSPLEHVCRPENFTNNDGMMLNRGNLTGWIQLRHLVANSR